MRYDNSTILTNPSGKRYFKGILYPLITPKDSDIYVITTSEDRLDILADQYYKDSTLYWIISISNNIRKDSMYIVPGTQLRIPTDIQGILQDFNDINKNR